MTNCGDCKHFIPFSPDINEDFDGKCEQFVILIKCNREQMSCVLSERKQKSNTSKKKMSYCEWSKCQTYNNSSLYCTFRYSGENCYTIYGHCTNKDFEDIDYESTKQHKSFRDYEKYFDKWNKENK